MWNVKVDSSKIIFMRIMPSFFINYVECKERALDGLDTESYGAVISLLTMWNVNGQFKVER